MTRAATSGGAAGVASCPLCGGSGSEFHRDSRRAYIGCSVCALVYVPPGEHLDLAAQKVHYDWHDNRPDDPRYRAFLSRLFDPLVARLPPGASGLDFGSGPGPTLSRMLAEAGFPTRIYDPIYAPDPDALARRYDFIASTETFEHLTRPGAEIARLVGLLEPGGWLAVMTKRVSDREAFARWHYIADPTHVCFFSERTFTYVAERYRLALEVTGDDTVLLRKRGAGGVAAT